MYRRFIKIPQNIPENISFKIAETTEELEGAFKLLHDAYVEVGLMKPDSSGMRVTPYHALPSSTTLIGKVNHEVVATVTIIRDSPMGLPSDSYVDLNHLRQSGDRVAEISALAIKRGYRGKLLFYLLKFMYENCVHYLGINHLIATLTTDSKSYELYESILFFKPIECKIETNYAFSNFRPVIAEHLNLDEAYKMFNKKYSGLKSERDLFSFFTSKVFNFNIFPSRLYHMINYPVMTLENFKHFFLDKTSALKNMTFEQLESLSEIYEGLPQAKLIKEAQAHHNVVSINNKIKRKNRFDISCKTMAKSGGGFLPIRILDVSNEGLRISCKEEISEFLELVLKDHFNKTHHLTAQIMWQNGHGVYGLKILKANDNWHEMIHFFEQEKSSASSEPATRKLKLA